MQTSNFAHHVPCCRTDVQFNSTLFIQRLLQSQKLRPPGLHGETLLLMVNKEEEEGRGGSIGTDTYVSCMDVRSCLTEELLFLQAFVRVKHVEFICQTLPLFHL